MFKTMESRFNRRIDTPDDYLAFVGDVLARYSRAMVTDKRTVNAYVNRGRWVADCLHCNGGMATEPGLERAGCLDCGHVYGVTFPAESDQTTARSFLSRRRSVDQNWNPHKGETTDDLRRENTFSLGLPPMKDLK